MPDRKGAESEILARIKKISQQVRKLQHDFQGEIRKPRRERMVSSDKQTSPKKKR